MSTIISVHLPKTAGTSFSRALENYFGADLFKDYADLPINTPVFDRNKAALEAGVKIADGGLPGVRCVHGHFLPVKYLLLASKVELTFITWLREPIERLLSHYYFWQRTYDPKNSPCLHRRFIEEQWSLERFCLGPELRNLYGQFLWGFPIERLGFVGITEFYDDDLSFFSRQYLHAHLEHFTENIGAEAGKYDIDPGLRQRIEAYHDYDMALYRKALDERHKRMHVAGL